MIGSPNDKDQFLLRYSALRGALSQRPDKLHKKKLAALEALLTRPRIADRAKIPGWKYAILLLKLDQLETVTTISEVDEVLLEAKDDRKLVYIPTNSRFWLLEEEALFWAQKSLDAPLSSDGYDRYMSIFRILCERYGKTEEYRGIMGE